MINDNSPLVIGIEEAGRLLGMSKATAYKAAKEGNLPGLRKIGGRMVVSVAALNEYLALTEEEKPH